MRLWNNDIEIKFFEEALKNFASPEQLFYSLESGFFAYVPKGSDAEGQTLQSRNSLIGKFTEKWAKDLLEPIAQEMGLFAVNDVYCDEIGLPRNSSADLAFCKTNSCSQKAEDIKLLFEIKMSIVSNYRLTNANQIEYVGDYKSHKGNPGLLRSDSMLKAIGKSINIRVSGDNAVKIPIVILGNSPITVSYAQKVDYLKQAGIIQGFWSLNPHPCESDYIQNTPGKGFITITNLDILKNLCSDLLADEFYFFSSMVKKQKLGELISIASFEPDDLAKAEKFLQLLRKI